MTRTRAAAPLGAIALLAVLLRTGTWWHAHALLGVMEYDDGVYYAASKLVLHGVLPYSGFTIVHPPVLSLLLLPAAVVGQLLGDPAGMVAARVEMQVVAVLEVLLVYRLALRLPAAPDRARRAALVAAALFAVTPDAVVAEHTVLLEPFVNLACLAGVWLLLRRDAPSAWAAAGCGFLVAAGVGTKLFAGVYVIAVLVWLLARGLHRRALPFAGGLAAGAAVLIAPFVLGAPSKAFHDVVSTQLSRPADATDDGLARLVNIVGLGYATTALGVVLLVVLLLPALVRVRREPGSPLTLWLVVLGLGLGAFMQSSSYFPHYGAFLAPPVVLLASRLVALPAVRPRLALTQLAALAALVVAFGIGVGADLTDGHGQPDLRAAGDLVPAGSCVYYDSVSLALAAGVYADPSDRCPGWIDGRGVALTQNTDWPADRSFYPAGFAADEQWQAGNVSQMRKASFLLLRSPPASFPEWSAGTRAYVLKHFVPVWVRHGGQRPSELWRRTSLG
jgi:4-amino-4-deoxy-L-arabinose transferase-like glycosyltransferase